MDRSILILVAIALGSMAFTLNKQDAMKPKPLSMDDMVGNRFHAFRVDERPVPVLSLGCAD